MCDSLAPAPTSNLFQQVASFLAATSTSILLKYIDVTMQNGYVDCGLFAIAFANNLWLMAMMQVIQKCVTRDLAKCIMAGKIPVKMRQGKRIRKITTLLLSSPSI